MDVLGRNADTETGEYFRRSVWGWRPLWTYCCAVADVCRNVQYGQSNDGDGLEAEDALELAKTLRANLASGATKAYIEQRDADLRALPDQTCPTCQGKAKRFVVDHGTRYLSLCNHCRGHGVVRPFETWYLLTERDIAEFAEFLEHSGGFSIC
jgi:hypothetical protein